MANYTLKDIRECYKESYVKGDIEMLRYLQHPLFFVKTDEGIVSRGDQLRKFEIYIKKNFADKSNWSIEEELVSQWTEGGATWVRSIKSLGKGDSEKIRSKDLECWIGTADGWRIVCLFSEYLN